MRVDSIFKIWNKYENSKMYYKYVFFRAKLENVCIPYFYDQTCVFKPNFLLHSYPNVLHSIFYDKKA